MFTYSPSPRPSRITTTIYADFASATSYLASVRQDRRLADGLRASNWCAVEHRPTIPVAGIRLDSRGRAARERELGGLRRLGFIGEVFDARVPGFIPNTRAAAVAYAEAQQAGRGDRMRRLLFEAYWVHGADIGHPDVLAHLAQIAQDPLASGAVDPAQIAGPGPAAADVPAAAAVGCVRGWQDVWIRLGAPIDLTVVTPYAVMTGASAVRALDADPVLAA